VLKSKKNANQAIKKTSKKTEATSAIQSTSKAKTMADLLKNYSWHGFKKGEVVEGIITEKNNKAVWVDIGAKTEGLILTKELRVARDFVNRLKVGDKINVSIFQPENENGYPLLSFRKTLNNFVWGEFEEKLKTGESIKVRGKEVNKGGLVVDVNGFFGFIPTSCFGAKMADKIKDLINKNFEAKIIEVDREKNRLILSEKEVSEKALLKEQKEALKKIKVGDVFEGEISGVMPFGLFVKVKVGKYPVEGLVHISEISWEKVDEPSKFYKPGDKVKVKTLLADKKTGKINFSLKQLQEDPWAKIEKDYPIDTKVKGEVVRLAPFGVFVALDKGIEGLIHISKIPAEKALKVGDKIDCFVESIDKEARKMSLGLVLKEKPIGYK
jgi:small subunit ribosomal protein S1